MCGLGCKLDSRLKSSHWVTKVCGSVQHGRLALKIMLLVAHALSVLL